MLSLLITFSRAEGTNISTGEHDYEVTALEWFAFDALPAKETVAFDHYDDLVLYQDYLSKKIEALPYLGKYISD
jgi:hypothetical protein